MCGIFGFTGPDHPALLERMGGALRHRGPDEDGQWRGKGIQLGMRRLAIIDPATGHQPVANENGDIQVIFNGEIYNHAQLRRDLQKRGHRFITDHSDSEVIPHLYEEFGMDFLNHLNGMFAIAIWDAVRRELHLARDHSGIKPLYHAYRDGLLVFASEIKAILLHPAVTKRPNFEALYHYFTFKNIPAPLSAFEGIGQLLPGERLLCRPDTGHVETQRWWRINFEENTAIDEQEAALEVRRLLEDSVRLQMRTDVPVGAYLSGGVDSSAVVALMSKLSGTRVKAFTLTYEDSFAGKREDEAFARKVARMYGVEHHEHRMTSGEILDHVEDILCAFDEPFSGVTSTYFLTKLISQHVKVALSGDGADELFASYLPHRLAAPLAAYESLRDPGHPTPDEHRQLSPFGDNLDFLKRTWSRGDEAARRMGQYLFDDREKAHMLSDGYLEHIKGLETTARVREHYNRIATRDPLNRALHHDFENLLPDQVLAFVDRLSMAHSVEIRPPFLDHRLIEYAATLPGSLKIRGGRVKHILKEALKDLLPDDLLDRPKEGFVLPINQWLQTQLDGFIAERLNPAALSKHGFFRPQSVEKILADKSREPAASGNRIWNILMFQIWWDQHFS